MPVSVLYELKTELWNKTTKKKEGLWQSSPLLRKKKRLRHSLTWIVRRSITVFLEKHRSLFQERGQNTACRAKQIVTRTASKEKRRKKKITIIIEFSLFVLHNAVTKTPQKKKSRKRKGEKLNRISR